MNLCSDSSTMLVGRPSRILSNHAVHPKSNPRRITLKAGEQRLKATPSDKLRMSLHLDNLYEFVIPTSSSVVKVAKSVRLVGSGCLANVSKTYGSLSLTVRIFRTSIRRVVGILSRSIWICSVRLRSLWPWVISELRLCLQAARVCLTCFAFENLRPLTQPQIAAYIYLLPRLPLALATAA